MNFNCVLIELGCELLPSANRHTHTHDTQWLTGKIPDLRIEMMRSALKTFLQANHLFINCTLRTALHNYQPIDVTSMWGRRNLTRNGRNGNTSVIEKPVENYENQKRPHYNVCSHSACTDMLHMHTPLTHPPVHSYSTHYQQPSDSINFDNLPSDAKPLQLSRNFGVTPWE